MTSNPSREDFERWAKTQGRANDEKMTLEQMMFMHIAWTAWQAGAQAERDRINAEKLRNRAPIIWAEYE